MERIRSAGQRIPRMPRSVLVKLVSVWIFLLIWGSFTPPAKVALGSSGKVISVRAISQTRKATLRHRVVHWCAFGSTALLLLLSARTHLQRVVATLSVATLGLMLELMQHYIYGGPIEWVDAWDDAAAAAAVLAIGSFTNVRHARHYAAASDLLPSQRQSFPEARGSQGSNL
jgi:hypothetical protein